MLGYLEDFKINKNVEESCNNLEKIRLNNHLSSCSEKQLKHFLRVYMTETVCGLKTKFPANDDNHQEAGNS